MLLQITRACAEDSNDVRNHFPPCNDVNELYFSGGGVSEAPELAFSNHRLSSCQSSKCFQNRTLSFVRVCCSALALKSVRQLSNIDLKCSTASILVIRRS